MKTKSFAAGVAVALSLLGLAGSSQGADRVLTGVAGHDVAKALSSALVLPGSAAAVTALGDYDVRDDALAPASPERPQTSAPLPHAPADGLPEPATWFLLMLGVGLIGAATRGFMAANRRLADLQEPIRGD